MDIQAMVDAWSAQMQMERSQSQLTLGELIAKLDAMPATTPVGLVEPHSYRGYYRDLAFEPGESTAGAVLEAARAALGATFEGYKGGDYVMGKSTPVWVASYGCCGRKLMDIQPDGSLLTAEDD